MTTVEYVLLRKAAVSVESRSALDTTMCYPNSTASVATGTKYFIMINPTGMSLIISEIRRSEEDYRKIGSIKFAISINSNYKH